MSRRQASSWMLGWLLVVIGCAASSLEPSLPPARTMQEAGLGPGDELEIRVTGHEDLSGIHQVADDGTIRFPWLGSLKVAGLEQQGLAETIETKLADGYLRDPHVTVRIIARQNREVSVLGQVQEPGSYPFKQRLSLVQAVSAAGGLTPLALPRKVKLIRDTQTGRQTFEVDLSEILEGDRPDLELEPGDIVFVPESPI